MPVDPVIPQPIAIQPQNTGSNVQNDNNASFGEALKDAMNKLNTSQVNADETVKGFLTGEVTDMHRVIAALDEAKFDMQLAVEVRNKLLESYNKVMRMRI